jgi:hypothetical protein
MRWSETASTVPWGAITDLVSPRTSPARNPKCPISKHKAVHVATGLDNDRLISRAQPPSSARVGVFTLREEPWSVVVLQPEPAVRVTGGLVRKQHFVDSAQ